MIRKLPALLIVPLMLFSCIYDYDPKDKDLEGLNSPLVVIDGDIIVGGITRVKVGFTRSLTEEQKVLPLGASVWVESEGGEILSGRVLEDETNGFEVNTAGLSLQGRYRLGVSIPGRGEYLSEFKGVLVSPPIDSITYSIPDDRSYARVEVTTHNDASGSGNGTDGNLYCKWNYTENWESDAVYPAELEYDPNRHNVRKLEWPEILARKYCFSEAGSKGTFIANTEKLSENIIYKSVINEIPNTDNRLMKLYSITVTQTALDKEAYIYWENIKKNSSGTGGLFAPLPSEVNGNIHCTTYPQERVIGYVNVSTISQKRAFIDWSVKKLFWIVCNRQLVPRTAEDGALLWPQFFYNGYRPHVYNDNGITYWALEKCTDCRSYSNSTRPDFWPEERNSE